eukprot:TRINITY_DN15122_c0_g1_i1.p1 TRINITY_DN15122_c0_g1~~TRINITY_DN15122_c0_g1_i1.p1  ORF type:complete len:132 (+),score=16.55 TRINITY_DN15122_c0_g1_i1:341-736(+)
MGEIFEFILIHIFPIPILLHKLLIREYFNCPIIIVCLVIAFHFKFGNIFEFFSFFGFCFYLFFFWFRLNFILQADARTLHFHLFSPNALKSSSSEFKIFSTIARNNCLYFFFFSFELIKKFFNMKENTNNV